MNTFRLARRLTALFFMGLMLAACGGQQEPAKQAIESAEQRLAAIREDAKVYLPEELGRMEASLAAMKSNYEKGNYSAVLAASRVLNTSLSTATSTIESQRGDMEAMTAELTNQWNSLSEELPEMVETVTARVESLTKTGKLPKDVDAATFERVKADAKAMTDRWQQALGAFSAGNMQEAVDMANAAKDKGSAVQMTLGMTG
jgi:hypothetical protein